MVSSQFYFDTGILFIFNTSGAGAGASNNLLPKCYTFLESGGLAELISEEKI